MKIFETLKGILQSAFSSSSPAEAPAIPEKIMLPLAWPAYVASHVAIQTTETMNTQICAARWSVAAETMRSTLDPSGQNREHRNFIGHINAMRAAIQISNQDMFPIWTENLMAVYNSRHIFDEISQALAARETDLSNVTLLPGATLPSGKAEAEMVSSFKTKYVEMMETAILPFLTPGWTKETSQNPQEKPGTSPWGRSGRRPF